MRKTSWSISTGRMARSLARAMAWRSIRKKPKASAASAPRTPSKSSFRKSARPSATRCTTSTKSSADSWSPESCSGTKGARPRCRCRNCEAILPRSEQIPGETHHANERVRATVCEVRKHGSRVKVILSRTRPALVERLFEQEIPEIADGVIEVRAMAREPGYRSKVAVSSTDSARRFRGGLRGRARKSHQEHRR